MTYQQRLFLRTSANCWEVGLWMDSRFNLWFPMWLLRFADNMHGHAFTFNRIANTWKSRDAKKESLAAFETLKQRKQPEKQYLVFRFPLRYV
jgi:hypothetical protein